MRNVIGKMTWIVGVALALVHLSAQAGTPRLDDLVDSVLRNGPGAQLPPNLTFVLGLGKGDAPLEVKQAMLRNGQDVRVFNVSVANHKNIVIIRTNEHERSTQAYLVSSAGKLRKAVSYEAGEQAHPISTKEAGAAAAGEIKFWTSQGQQRAGTP